MADETKKTIYVGRPTLGPNDCTGGYVPPPPPKKRPREPLDTQESRPAPEQDGDKGTE